MTPAVALNGFEEAIYAWNYYGGVTIVGDVVRAARGERRDVFFWEELPYVKDNRAGVVGARVDVKGYLVNDFYAEYVYVVWFISWRGTRVVLLGHVFPVRYVDPLVDVSFLVVGATVESTFRLDVNHAAVVRVDYFSLNPVVAADYARYGVLRRVGIRANVGAGGAAGFSVCCDVINCR